MSEEGFEIYRKVGKLAAEVREEVKKEIKPGIKLLEIAEKTENLIREGGAELAFPCNIAINEVAAHYSPPEDDETEIEEGDLINLDLGAHIDGYIADTATTVATREEDQAYVETIEEVLDKAIEVVEPGIGVGEIGKVIEQTAQKSGFKPISNLSGHSLGRWSLHAGTTIPNVKKESEEKLEEGDVVALEPFITKGAGEVEEGSEVYIFRYREGGGAAGRMARRTLRIIKGKYENLPFASRWLTEDLSRIRIQMTLPELAASGALRPYNVLKDKENGRVAQAEHTVIVREEGPEVTTRLPPGPGESPESSGESDKSAE